MGDISKVKPAFALEEVGFEGIPYWILVNNHKDFNHKKPGEKGYDSGTLYVPSEELLNLSLILQ